MAKPTYYELLQSPHWQRKRLEIMGRDKFKCRDCGADDKPLHVHHVYYEKGRMPWEYDDHLLITVCDECHGYRQTLQNLILIPTGGLSLDEMRSIAGYGLAKLMLKRGKTSDISSLSESHRQGFYDAGWPRG